MNKRVAVSWSFRVLLTAITVGALIHQLWMKDGGNVFTVCLTLVLLWGTTLLLYILYTHVPLWLEIWMWSFIVMAQLLGGVYLFYMRISVWDTLLHGMKGVWATVIGLSLPRLFRVSCRSPLFTAVVAVCFTMTLGILWEFGEFSLDMLFHTDTQKDWIISDIYSVYLQPRLENTPVHIAVDTLSVNGNPLDIGGYLDIGLIDTMKDLFVSFVTAVVTAVVGVRCLYRFGTTQ